MTIIKEEFHRLHDLSLQLSLVGTVWAELAKGIERAEFGWPSQARRRSILSIAVTDDERRLLCDYWTEFARERLSALRGPADILAGTYPPICAYKSALLDSLRRQKACGSLPNESVIISPQIQPTFKRYVEMLATHPEAIRMHQETVAIRSRESARIAEDDDAALYRNSESERFAIFRRRLGKTLSSGTFELRSSGSEFSYSRVLSCEQWAFGVADASTSTVKTGVINPYFFLQDVTRKNWKSSRKFAATFLPDDVIPAYAVERVFKGNSWSDMYLTADTLGVLTKVLYAKINELVF